MVIPCKYWHPCARVPGLLHPLARVRNCDFMFFNINILSKSRGAPAARRGDPVQALAPVRPRPEIASPAIYYRNHEERLRRDVVIPCKYWHPCASSSSRGASQIRRGDPLTPQVQQVVCKWIAFACRRRNDDSFFPVVPTKAGIAAPLSGLASSILYFNIDSKSRGAPAARRGDPVQVLALVRPRPGIASPACAGSQLRFYVF